MEILLLDMLAISYYFIIKQQQSRTSGTTIPMSGHGLCLSPEQTKLYSFFLEEDSPCAISLPSISLPSPSSTTASHGTPSVKKLCLFLNQLKKYPPYLNGLSLHIVTAGKGSDELKLKSKLTLFGLDRRN
jgi:hypothetical protein